MQAGANQVREPSLRPLSIRLPPQKRPCMEVPERPDSLATLRKECGLHPAGHVEQTARLEPESSTLTWTRGHLHTCPCQVLPLEFHPLLSSPPASKHPTLTNTQFILCKDYLNLQHAWR